jgi:hypothetical protein
VRWQKISGPLLRETGRRPAPGMVEVELVKEKREGDLDLRQMEVWRTNYKGHSYVISRETEGQNKDLGYTASVKIIDPKKEYAHLERIEGQAHILVECAKTFHEAELACENHARGRRDA